MVPLCSQDIHTYTCHTSVEMLFKVIIYMMKSTQMVHNILETQAACGIQLLAVTREQY